MNKYFQPTFVLVVGIILLLHNVSSQSIQAESKLGKLVNPIVTNFEHLTAKINMATIDIVATPNQNSQLTSGKETTLTGTFKIVYFDTLTDDFKESYYLEVENTKNAPERYPLLFVDTNPSIPAVNSQITVTGKMVGKEINVESSTIEVIKTSEKQEQDGDSDTAIIMFTITPDLMAGDSHIPTEFTTEYVNNKVFLDSDSVSNFYIEGSHEQQHISGDVLGIFNITGDTSTCDSFFAWTNSVNALLPPGTFDSYDRFVYVFPRVTACGGYLGWADFSGNRVWINGIDNRFRFTVIHELGHTFGLDHAKAIICPGSAIDNYANCSIREYGNPTDVMGPVNSEGYPYLFNYNYQKSLDWLSYNEVQIATQSGIYTLAPIEHNPLTATNPQTIVIQKWNTNELYFLEYRQPIGTFDSLLPNNATRGTLVNIAGLGNGYTKLVDTHFDTQGVFSDAALEDGYEFIDQINNILVRQISHSEDAVQLYIEYLQEDEQNAPAISFSEFGGIDDTGYVELVDSTGATLIGDDLTIEAWIKPYAITANSKFPLFSKFSNSRNELIYSLDIGKWENAIGGPYLQFNFNTDRNYFGFAATSVLIPPNAGEWIHVALTKDNNEYRLFINGVQKAYYPLFPTLGNIADDADSTYRLSKYLYNEANRAQYMGMIDDVRVSNTARDIANNWSTGVYNFPLVIDEHSVIQLRFDGSHFDFGPNRIPSTTEGTVLYVEGTVPWPEAQTVKELRLNIQNDDVVLSWQPSDGARRYNIYRGDTAYFTADQSSYLASTIESGFVDNTSNAVGNPDLNYFYIVKAEGATGESTNSNTVGFFNKEILPQLNLVSFPLVSFSNPMSDTLSQQLTGDSSEERADRLWLLDYDIQDYRRYWLNNEKLWIDSTTGTPTNITIDAGQSFWIESRQQDNQVITFDGEVPTAENQEQIIRPGIQLISSIYPTDFTLYNASFIEDGAFGASTELYADRVWSWNPEIQDYDYAWLINGVGPDYDGRWWDGTPFEESSIQLKPGFGYIYQRRGTDEFVWSNPAP